MITSGVSQPESAAGQRQQGSYVGISTTINSPKSMQIPTDYQQRAGLRVLPEVNTSQINPFEALATQQTITFDNDNQGQSASLYHLLMSHHDLKNHHRRPMMFSPW